MSTITTARLLFKAITPALVQELFTTKEKQEIIEALGLDEAGYEKYKLMNEEGMESYRISSFCFSLFDKQTLRPLGACGFHTWNKGHHKAEIFYHINEEQDRNQGYISEALPLVLDYGFKELKLHRIEARLSPHNIPSVKLVQRFGFTREGMLRQDYFINDKFENSDCYSLLKEEWEAGDLHAAAKANPL